MLADSYIVPRCLVAPGSLGGLLALYEANYIRLTAIYAPVLLGRGDRLVSRSSRDLDLHLAVEARTRYTVDIRLTYFFGDSAGNAAEPDLLARLYLDARMVEVLSWAGSTRHPVLRTLHDRAGRELNRRWARNMVLGKWLEYLTDMGHSFEA